MDSGFYEIFLKVPTGVLLYHFSIGDQFYVAHDQIKTYAQGDVKAHATALKRRRDSNKDDKAIEMVCCDCNFIWNDIFTHVYLCWMT